MGARGELRDVDGSCVSDLGTSHRGWKFVAWDIKEMGLFGRRSRKVDGDVFVGRPQEFPETQFVKVDEFNPLIEVLR